MTRAFRVILLLLAAFPQAQAGVYVTEASGIRWNDVGGIRWNDVGGIRWNDVGGLLVTEASGIRWNDVGGIRWNDVGGIEFIGPVGDPVSIDLELLRLVGVLPDSSSINVIITYRGAPAASDLDDLVSLGITGGTVLRVLPMVVVHATRSQIDAIADLPRVRSIYANRTLSFFDDASGARIGLPELSADLELRPRGTPLTGEGVTIAVLDSGVDAGHPDLPFGGKVVQNVRLGGSSGGAGFVHPARVEGLVNTDLVLGHGTFVASVAAGTGQAGGGRYEGVAPGASVLGLAAGDLFILNVLEGFDYILEKGEQHGVKVVNCSWGTQGFFDPHDPVNIATRSLHDAGMTVVFAAGNHGPAPDTLNPYAVAPWVIGVGSSRKDGSLSRFSSRGLFEELLYRPTLLAPGEGIIAAKASGLAGVDGVTGVGDPSGGVSVPPGESLWYTAASGTSFAAPHVAGVIALMLEAEPGLTPGQIKRLLQQTAVPLLRADRSQAGAGGLDAWAALALTLDGERPFGTHVAGWLDQRPYRIDHLPPALSALTVPAGGSAIAAADVSGAVASWQATISWNRPPGTGDLDMRAVSGSGAEVERSDGWIGPSLFGRTEGMHLMAVVPEALQLDVHFKQGVGPLDQPFELRQQKAVAAITAYTDLAPWPAGDQEAITRAVSRHVMIGRGSRFEPAAALTRAELARALALAGGAPQRIPSSPSFADVPPSDPDFPYVESAAGLRARARLMDASPSRLVRVLGDPSAGDGPRAQAAFAPRHAVRRLDYAVAVVRAAGLEAEALARAGEPLGLADESSIPEALKGYAAVALGRGFIEPVALAGGEGFDPDGPVSRLSAARFLVKLLD
ncbi:MAG TPA: S8 family serine peptidase [Candidatus Polarisedimenticolia bacterium]|nr:S8 family serine peptidase [Candidatus Polarisedimenticolia bacterium]